MEKNKLNFNKNKHMARYRKHKKYCMNNYQQVKIVLGNIHLEIVETNT